MFPDFVTDQDFATDHCSAELWAWREAKQYFVAYRDWAQGNRAKGTDYDWSAWQYLAKCYAALKCAYEGMASEIQNDDTILSAAAHECCRLLRAEGYDITSRIA